MPKEFDYSAYMRETMKRQLEQVRYCPFCGKPVLPYATNEHGYENRYVDWEMKYGTHWDCYTKQSRSY